MTTEIVEPKRSVSFREIAVWSAQIILAIVFALAGAFKAFTAPSALLAKAPDLGALPLPFVRFIGIAELAAAAGFILPSLTRIAPLLTPIASLCVLPILAGAFVVDLKAGHFGSVALVIVCSALAIYVAWTRFTSGRIAERKPRSLEPIERNA